MRFIHLHNYYNNVAKVAKYSKRRLQVPYITREHKDEEMKKGVVEGNYQLVFLAHEMLLLRGRFGGTL